MRKKRLHRSRWMTVAAPLAALALVACADEAKPPKSPQGAQQDDGGARITVSRSQVDDSSPTAGSIQVDEEIAKSCDLPTAHFPFDSAKITGSAADMLDALAKCFTEGALRGRSLKIVGHADPRGTTEYNFALGQRRAGSVEQYLSSRGLPEGKMASSSMGELEAEGSDEASWARDRKVEILLAERMMVPEEDESPYTSTLDE